MRTSAPTERSDDLGPVAPCGACGRRSAYVVAGREVVRCRQCSARGVFDRTDDVRSDLLRTAPRLRAYTRRALRWQAEAAARH